MSSGYLLLTGATGLLGRYLLRDLLLEGVPLAVLIRGQGPESAAERLGRVLGQWEEELGRPLPRPVCLEGDLTAADLGLSAESQRWVAWHCTAVLHNAASLVFSGSDRHGEPWRSNLTGTSHLLDLCRRLGLRELHHVSTAYVCGVRPGPVLESELEHDFPFRNDYERSKYEGELLVRRADFFRQRTVYRPAIIVGDSRTGYTSTYHGLYSYLYFAAMLRRYAPREPDGRWQAPIRLNITGAEVRNLVPVDWVAAVMTRLLTQPRHHGRTYHLTPPRPVTARDLEAGMADIFGYYGTAFTGPDGVPTEGLSDVEKAFYDFVARYAPYWAREPVFDCTNTLAAAPNLPCPAVDLAMLRRLVEFAEHDNWGKRSGKRRERPEQRPAVMSPTA